MEDTPIEILRRQAQLLHDAGPGRRASLAVRMTNDAIARAKGGIRAAHPELSEREWELLFVRVHYGESLAAAVRARLESKQ